MIMIESKKSVLYEKIIFIGLLAGLAIGGYAYGHYSNNIPKILLVFIIVAYYGALYLVYKYLRKLVIGG